MLPNSTSISNTPLATATKLIQLTNEVKHSDKTDLVVWSTRSLTVLEIQSFFYIIKLGNTDTRMNNSLIIDLKIVLLSLDELC